MRIVYIYGSDYYLLTMKIAQVLHCDGKQAVIRMDSLSKLKSRAYDMNGNQVGTLVRIFGPVSRPFGLVSLKGSLNSDKLEIRERWK